MGEKERELKEKEIEDLVSGLEIKTEGRFKSLRTRVHGVNFYSLGLDNEAAKKSMFIQIKTYFKNGNRWRKHD